MSAWGNEDESTSSSSTLASSHSRRRETSINVMEVRDRIVKKIMEKKRREEEQKREEGRKSSAQPSKRPSRAPLADLPQEDDQPEIAARPSTSREGRENQDRSHDLSSADLSHQRSRVEVTQKDKKSLEGSPRSATSRPPVYSSTPLLGRFTPARTEGDRSAVISTGYPAHRVRSPAKGQKSSIPVIRESETEESPLPSPKPRRSVSHKTPTAISTGGPKRGKPKKETKSTRRKPVKVPDPEAPAFPPSDDDEAGEESPPAAAPEEEEEPVAGTSTQAAKSSRKAGRPDGTPKTKQSSAAIIPTPPAVVPARTSGRRKNVPKKSTPESRVSRMFTEMRRLQDQPGFLIPRLPFMRLVREIASDVAVNGSNYKFTVDAMEAIQTASEYYVTNVFSDAAKLANHAKRITIMPKDLELLRTLRIVDT